MIVAMILPSFLAQHEGDAGMGLAVWSLSGVSLSELRSHPSVSSIGGQQLASDENRIPGLPRASYSARMSGTLPCHKVPRSKEENLKSLAATDQILLSRNAAFSDNSKSLVSYLRNQTIPTDAPFSNIFFLEVRILYSGTSNTWITTSNASTSMSKSSLGRVCANWCAAINFMLVLLEPAKELLMALQSGIWLCLVTPA